jgi:glutamyl-tRNA synthetase
VGGARTALFNWTFARHAGGVLVLRIEDTDRERSRPELTRAIIDGLAWLGLGWDEGPYHQADNLGRHRADVERLLESGSAYRCFCPPERLERLRQEAVAEGRTAAYDRRCRDVSVQQAVHRAAAGELFTVRFRIPAGETIWADAVAGRMSFQNDDIDDFILLRSDGTPTYNMAVVSDDIAMRISHVIRGADHLSNTPKQIQVYHALDASVPTFAHVPLILGPDGKRLSKRHSATALGEYREAGYLPEAMVNFLALLGWSPGGDVERMSIDELVDRFTLEGINRKSAVFDQGKLDWLNGQYLSERSGEELAALVGARLLEAGVPDGATLDSSRERLARVLDSLKVRARTVRDLAHRARPFFPGPIDYEADAVERLDRLAGALRALDDWSEAELERATRALAEDLGVGAGKLIHPLRLALTGSAVSPGIFEVMHLMGRDLVLRRIADAIEKLTRS